MSIQLTIELRSAEVLLSFAAWWDAQAPGDVGTEKPVPYMVADPEPVAALPQEPGRPSAHPSAERTASVPPPKEIEITMKPKAKPASSAVITPTLDNFTAAVKTWYTEDGKTRAPKVKAALDARGIKKLVDVPVDQFASFLTDLGVS